MRQPQHPAEDRREAVRQPAGRTEVEHTEPPVGQQAEVARVRIGVQEPDPGRTREQERMIMAPARSRSAVVPPAMMAASGMPSSHSLTSRSVADGDHASDADVRIARA